MKILKRLNLSFKQMEKFCEEWTLKHNYICLGCPLHLEDGKYIKFTKPCFLHLFRDLFCDYEEKVKAQRFSRLRPNDALARLLVQGEPKCGNCIFFHPTKEGVFFLNNFEIKYDCICEKGCYCKSEYKACRQYRNKYNHLTLPEEQQ